MERFLSHSLCVDSGIPRRRIRAAGSSKCCRNTLSRALCKATRCMSLFFLVASPSLPLLTLLDCPAAYRTGRTAVFPSYESFLGIVTTMIEQYGKFLKMASETRWRGDVASLNYIETSTLWRQEHNGYSHQVSLLAPSPPTDNCQTTDSCHTLKHRIPP